MTATFTLLPQVGSRQTFAIAIPTALMGQMIQFSIQFNEFGRTTLNSCEITPDGFINTAPTDQLGDQLYFLDNIQLSANAMAAQPQVGVVTSASGLDLSNTDLTLAQVDEARRCHRSAAILDQQRTGRERHVDFVHR